MKTILVILSLVMSFSVAKASEFITQAEIENSNLSQTEKGLALVAVLTKPVIECVSSNEGIGSDSERLQIYYMEIGNVFKASVAVWKTQNDLKVFGGFDNPATLKAAFAKGAATSFGTESGGFTDNSLQVKYGQIIPMIGKIGELTFANGTVAGQICSVSK